MSSDDIKYLRIGDPVRVGVILSESVFGRVRGIDTWSLQVRVETDEFTCEWYPPRLIKQYTESE